MCVVGRKVDIQEKHFIVKTVSEAKAQIPIRIQLIHISVRNVGCKDEGSLEWGVATSEAKSRGALRSLGFNPVGHRDFQ